jgi:hypothetical protein
MGKPRTPRIDVQAQRQGPNFAAILRHLHISASNHSGSSLPQERNSDTWRRVRVSEAVDLPGIAVADDAVLPAAWTVGNH